jgi:hypothetical protein
MELTNHLAAYGLFQHQFAYLDGSLTKTLVALMKWDPDSERPLKKRLTFGQRLTLLADLSEDLANRYDLAKRVPEEMRSWAQGATEEHNPYQDLKAWIKKARLLSYWRNDRVHGRLAFDATTGAAYLVNESDSVLDADHDTCIAKARRPTTLWMS